MKLTTSISVFILISICATVQPAINQPVFYGVNCGSAQSYITPTGDYFAPDQAYNPASGFGYQGTGTVVVGPTHPPFAFEPGFDRLYLFQREGEFSYLFDVPSGQYALTLYLIEGLYHWRDYRTFSVLVENEIYLIQDLDIFDQVGRYYGMPMRFLVNCVDGQLNVDFIPGIANATVSAISVRSIQPDILPPEPVLNFTAMGGYNMNILDWSGNIEDDLAGYRIYRRSMGGPWILLTLEAHHLSRYFDCDAVPYAQYEYQVTSEDLWGNESSPGDPLAASAITPEASSLPVFSMELTEENLYLLNYNIWSDLYVDADLTLEGEFFPESGVRYRGGWSRMLSKKNHKLKLPDGVPFEDREKFNLQAEINDFSMIKDRLCYQTYDSVNCLNPHYQNVHLQRNGEFIGVYLDFEQVNNRFLEKRGLSTSGNIYKCYSDLSILSSYGAYMTYYTKENHPESDWYDLIDFIEWLNLSSQAEFHSQAGERFALDEYLDIFSVLIATSDQDFVTHNYFMYHNPADSRWYFVHYDHDLSFLNTASPINLGTSQQPLGGNYWNKLWNKVLGNVLFRHAYCKKLERLLDNSFSIPSLQAQIVNIHNEIVFDGIRDMHKHGWEDPSLFLGGPDSLNQFIEARVSFLQEQIPLFDPDPDLAPYFRLNEIQSNNLTTIADEMGDFDPWIEIVNLAPVELDLEGFILHCGSFAWILPEGAVVDDYGHLLLWIDGEPGEGLLHASFLLPTGGAALQIQSPHGSLADSVSYPTLNEDQVFARLPDGTGTWTDNILPTPGYSNDPSEDPSELVINEFLAINESCFPDPFGEYDDWAEIYNLTDDTISLGGLYLTDNFNWPTKWVFPDTSILPFAYLLLWCDEDQEQGPLHTNFKLSGDGEELGLFDRDGITPIDTIAFAEQEADISYGRFPDGTSGWQQLIPTPESANQPLISLLVSLTPYDPPIVIPESGGSFDYNIAVQNQTATPLSFDIWTEVILPGGGSVPIFTVTSLSIPGSTTLDRDRTQQVPSIAPAGTYTYCAYIGTYPWLVDHQDSFTFTKEGSDSGSPFDPTEGWVCTGEDFAEWQKTMQSTLPQKYTLCPAYPNPFNLSTRISFELPETAEVNLTVYNIAGGVVATLIDRKLSAGTHHCTFHASGLASGIYFCRLKTAHFTASGKIILLK